ncbi:MAG: hypothetical protein EOP82_08445 [Variovorax sp.]|nr:MAG: hypothetical protein EOP82_08445 [Variovorax sp.]
MRGVFAAWLLLPLVCAAESTVGTTSASARVTLRVVVPPVFRILQVTPVLGGYQYRIWTNTRSVMLNGREYRFDKVGDATLTVPAAPDELFVHHGL